MRVVVAAVILSMFSSITSADQGAVCASLTPISAAEEAALFGGCENASCPKLDCREIESLTYLTVTGATFRGSRIGVLGYSQELSSLRNSDLRSVQIQHLYAANLSGSDLRGAVIVQVEDLNQVELTGAVFDSSSRFPFDRATAIQKGMVER